MTIALLYILLSVLIVISIYVIISRNLFSVIISTTIFSMVCALIFLLLDAIDVSLTEAAVGAGISTILFLSTIRYVDIIATDTKKSTVPIVILFFLLLDAIDVSLTEAAVGAGISTILFLSTIRYVDIIATDTKKSAVPIVILFFLLLISISILIYDLPEPGKANVVNNSQATKYYINNSTTEMGVPNVVTSVLAGYRGFDTLGEVIVIFIAGISVLGILRNTKGRT